MCNCMMLLRTPHMLKKSAIDQGKAMNYLALIVRVVHVCVEKPSAVAFGGKEMKPALTVVS